jgi:hypothetical protein
MLLVCIMKQLGNLIVIIITCYIIETFPKTCLSIIGIFGVFIVYLLIKDEIRQKRIKRLIKKNDNKQFMLYSSNKRLKPTIETKLKPLFDFDYTIIYNNRNKIESDLDEEIINYLQNNSIGYKLPILYKITKEKVLVTSFYEDVYEFKEQRIIQEVFEKRVTNKLNKQS